MDNNERLELGEQDKISEIFNTLCEMSKNYYETRGRAFSGESIGDILDGIVNDYEDNILPQINGLSLPAKRLLQDLVEEQENNLDGKRMDHNLFEMAYNDINQSIHVK